MQQLSKLPEIQYGHMEIPRHCYFSKGNCHCHIVNMKAYMYTYVLNTINKTKKQKEKTDNLRDNCRIKNRWK